MMTILLLVIYVLVAGTLLWQAFKVMSKGLMIGNPVKGGGLQKNNVQNSDRTGLVTVHPEILDNQGKITNEDLLTVRFSRDNYPPQSSEPFSE